MERIVSLSVFSDEVLWQLGPGVRRRVVAVSHLADDPRYSAVAGLWPAHVARVQAQVEPVLRVDADLVIVSSFSGNEIGAAFAQAGISVLRLGELRGFADFRMHVRTVGDRIAASHDAQALVMQFDGELQRLAQSARHTSVVSWNDGIVAGAHTTFADVAAAAGLVHLAARAGLAGYPRLSVEQLLRWQPDLVVVPCGTDCNASVAQFRRNPGTEAFAVAAVEDRLLSSTGLGMLELVTALRIHAR